METQSTTGEKKGFLQNDRMLVCGMLVVYGVCILIAVGAAFWGLNRRTQQVRANETATAVAASTQQAQATSTAAVRLTEQAGYDFIETFDSNRKKWRSGKEDSDYWTGFTDVEDGVYAWDIRTVKDTFVSWADFPGNNYLRDFDAYVDTKIARAEYGDACSGLMFRVSPAGWGSGGYYFALCNNGEVEISYHTDKDGWETLASPYYSGYRDDWNRLAIVARNSHFQFYINGDYIYEVEDNRQDAGGLALVVEVSELTPVEIWFDNFGLQRR